MDTNHPSDIVDMWRQLPPAEQRIVYDEARARADRDPRSTAPREEPGSEAPKATVAELFAEWWKLDRHTEPANDAEYAANNDRMRDLTARMIATPPTSPADIAMAVIADTYHGSFTVDDGRGLLTLCYALAGVPMPHWCQRDTEGDDNVADEAA